MDSCKVDGLVPAAFGGGTFTSEDSHHSIVAEDLEGLGDTGGVWVLGANAGGLGEDPEVAIRPMIGQLSPPGEAIGGAGKDSHEDIGETQPPRQSDTHV